RRELPGGATGERRVECCLHVTATQQDLRLLVCGQVGEIGWRLTAVARRVAGDQTALIPPCDAVPGASRLWLILQVSGLLERLIVVDAERHSGRHWRLVEEDAADLRPE